MKSISIRNVPENVYITLQEIAKVNRRSLQEQVKCILEREANLVKRLRSGYRCEVAATTQRT